VETLIEVEIKVKIDDLEKVAQALHKLNAVFIAENLEVDAYFQHPARDFAETDEALRIRAVKNNYQLTYKGPKLDTKSKTRLELTISISDGNIGKKIFEYLGFKPVMEIKKKRRIYQIGSVYVMLDNVEGLGTFIELETEVSNEKEISEKREDLIKLMVKLGISEDRFERRSYLELMRDTHFSS